MSRLQGRWADPGFQKAYLSVVSVGAESVCAPFWWSCVQPGETVARIRYNGTICYVNTGSRCIGVTADHVYQKYLNDVDEFGAEAIECQFGSSTINPEQRLIDRNKFWDVATLDVPEVFVGASARNPKTHHSPSQWPPDRATKSDVLLYGGFPGSLREEKGPIAELPFQWVAGLLSDLTDRSFLVEPRFETLNWQGQERNEKLGGWSGGPVFRSNESGPIARLEMVGFIFEFPLDLAVRATHADVVLPDGTLRPY